MSDHGDDENSQGGVGPRASKDKLGSSAYSCHLEAGDTVIGTLCVHKQVVGNKISYKCPQTRSIPKVLYSQNNRETWIS